MTARTRLAVWGALATLLAASAFSVTFVSLAWLLPAAGAVALVVGVGELCRRAAVPPVLGPLLAIVALAGYVTAVFASSAAVYGVLPGRAAVALLADHTSQGFEDVRALATPVPTNTGLVLLAVVGVALVALLVDVLAVSLRRPALAGVPLLALFAVPASVEPEGLGWLPFALGASGYLALLLADGRDRLSRWGRPLGAGRAVTGATPTAAERAETSPLAAVGRRIGLAAVAAGLVLPAAVPGLSGGLLNTGGGNGLPTTGGSSSVTTFNPIVRLKGYLNQKDPKDLMRVQTSDPDPGYIRLAALDRFDGRTWSESPLVGGVRSRVADGLPTPTGLRDTTRSTRTSSTIAVTDALDAHWLPTPYPPTSVDARGDWRFDAATATIFSTRANARELKYKVVSRKVTPDPAALEQVRSLPPDLVNQTDLPPNLPASIAAKARTITAGKSAAYDKAVLIQRYLRTFTYDVSVPGGNSESDLVNFLAGRRGYCEQFAATMAVFAREVGIPARVAIGFTRGSKQRDGSWKITSHDAHAWPELYFDGAGWLPFEPTPIANARASSLDYADGVSPGGDAAAAAGAGGAAAAPKSGTDARANKLNQTLKNENQAVPTEAPEQVAVAGAGGWPLRLLAGLAALLVLALAPLAVRLLVRRSRWRGAGRGGPAAHAAWAEVRDDASDLGHPWPASASPRSAGAALVQAGGLTGAAADAVALLVRAEERARYAPAGAGVQTAGTASSDLQAAVRTVRTSLLDNADGWRRWQARVFPMSSVRLTRVVGTWMADAMDYADAVGARLARRATWRRSAAGPHA